ncbi:hypothetical protein OHB05_37430 [Streptomyces sp. NBC_00638]|uniref:hypothetical protein n=1 Tax=unclassified Streptomyces TaxID=2593676 RepID=UPI002259B84C|nr:hypothetical protein [Streptomyces sp. NBC_00638]MCX5008257.1 hypothetical protein [Streptomyces sp. NBC_00638]
MNDLLTALACLGLIAVAAYMIHRLNIQHAERIAEHRYSAARPARGGPSAPQPPVGPPRSDASAAGERRDHRDGGRGRFSSRRHPGRTPQGS